MRVRGPAALSTKFPKPTLDGLVASAGTLPPAAVLAMIAEEDASNAARDAV